MTWGWDVRIFSMSCLWLTTGVELLPQHHILYPDALGFLCDGFKNGTVWGGVNGECIYPRGSVEVTESKSPFANTESTQKSSSASEFILTAKVASRQYVLCTAT